MVMHMHIKLMNTFGNWLIIGILFGANIFSSSTGDTQAELSLV